MIELKDLKQKNKKIQFYTPVAKKIEGSVTYKRKYPYTQSIYTAGGLWAYVRQLSGAEKFQNGIAVDKEIILAELNYNTKINSKMKAVFNGNIYDVGTPDNFEFNKEKNKSNNNTIN